MDERERRYQENESLDRLKQEINREQKHYEELKTQLDAMPKGEDPQTVRRWIEGRWDMADSEDGSWIESTKIDPVRTAWERQAEKLKQQQQFLDQLRARTSGIQESREISRGNDVSFLERARELNGQKLENGEIVLQNDRITFYGDGFVQAVWEQGQWIDPSRTRLSRREKETVAAVITSLKAQLEPK